jgi:DNA-binding response OmpR family regulator
MSKKQDTPPTILLVEQDDETRSLLKYNLRNRGYRAIIALDEEDAIARTRDGHECPDLILLSQYLLPLDEVINMGRRIRQDAGFPSGTPLVVMAERYGADMEGKDVRVSDGEYVTYLEDGEQLMNLLYRICPVSTPPNQPA